MRTLAFLAIAASGIFAQSPGPRPNFDAFEVATIKLTPPDWSGGRYIRMQTAHQLEARNNAVKTLIAAAYNLNPNAISRGPEWIDSDRYDILAKAPAKAGPTWINKCRCFAHSWSTGSNSRSTANRKNCPSTR
jgi:hypothetical protein